MPRICGPRTSWPPAARRRTGISRRRPACARWGGTPLELRSGADPNAYGNAIAEDRRFFALGVDGIFTDDTDTAVVARAQVG